MSRTVKLPEERRKELMMTASSLFMEQGYEETSVNAIIEKAGVAKGTFYYYFKSKEEMLKAILESAMEEYSQNLVALSSREELSPYDKLSYILSSITMPRHEKEALTLNINDRKDDKIHMELENKFFEIFYPIILKVIKEGIDKKQFNMKYPEEITEIITIGIQGFMHNHLKSFGDYGYAQVKISALEELLTKILGNTEKEFRFTFK